LSYKTGYCWASNKFLDGTKSGNTAKRQIKELIDAGYIKSRFDDKGTRQLYICEANSKIGNDTPRPEMVYPQTENGLPPDQKRSIPQTENGLQTLQDITNLNKQKKETEKDKETVFLDLPVHEKSKPPEPPPDDETIKCKEDATTIFNKARNFWNECELKPECRDLIIRPVYLSDIMRTFQHYTWEEIRNAIGNYAWHKTKAGAEYTDPSPYGSLAGFLKTGVERYFDDNALDQQFKKGK